MHKSNIFSHVTEPQRIDVVSECDFYGASRLLLAKSWRGYKSGFGLFQKQHQLKGFWTHGWTYFPPDFLELYRWHETPSSWPLLVHREEEVRALTGLGSENVHAVGAPFVYCDEINVKRLDRSLLVMPFHSLESLRPRYEEEKYFQALDSVLSRFDVVAACVHPSCLRSGRWIEGFKKRAIPYVTGAEASDRNGLLRMRQILSRFTHVTSNWIGSHIVYAAFCGSRVSIYGPRPLFHKEDFLNEPFYRKHPQILDWWLELENSSYLHHKYSFLFVTPEEASARPEWASWELGADNKRAPDELVNLLSVK